LEPLIVYAPTNDLKTPTHPNIYIFHSTCQLHVTFVQQEVTEAPVGGQQLTDFDSPAGGVVPINWVILHPLGRGYFWA